MFSAAMGLALAIAPGQAPRPAVHAPLLCQSDLPDVNGSKIAWVNLSVDEAFRPVDAELYVRTDEIEASWALNHPLLEGDEGLREFSYQLDLPSSTKFPVAAEVLSGGRLLWTRRFAQATNSIVRYTPQGVDPASGRTLAEIGSATPYIRLLDPKAGRVPNMMRTQDMRVRVTGADGRVVLSSRLRLPNWKWVRNQMRAALSRAERMRKHGSCVDSVVI